MQSGINGFLKKIISSLSSGVVKKSATSPNSALMTMLMLSSIVVFNRKRTEKPTVRVHESLEFEAQNVLRPEDEDLM